MEDEKIDIEKTPDFKLRYNLYVSNDSTQQIIKAMTKHFPNSLPTKKIKNFFVDQVLFGDLKTGGKAVADIENDAVVIKLLNKKYIIY